MNKVGIIDLGYGNLGSIYNSVSSITYEVIISKNYKELKKTDIIILPGIGSAGVFAKSLVRNGLNNFLLDHIKDNKLLIAICLGFQYLFSYTPEDGGVEGLSIFPQKVIRIDNTRYNSSRTGWYTVNNMKNFGFRKNNCFFYFNHSYAIKPYKNYFQQHGLSSNFLAWIKKKNVIGLQFHPEKSQKNGKNILKFLLG